ncbi:methylmalonyl-CoA mutase family protein [Brevibacillus centrosporus]|uniref:fused isobutyryl-CoA mutase/GTPase IcmF n=1 Tax=Brevibacillus centrosporus TaxID=54910 RepID=UPI000F09D400|nr:fused isobutyryl-CoA mutase/GTPase IcmF [Brevibacillus centrosporus]MEC2130430.1 methylmalonyl-CoA mutase family protein [Brevibacillus centrosporus]RNB68966.1 methylmalonyl-CoA mutase [Brevibacillus centrosporus]GED32627.1 Fused isobutyryl-CoA mutase [Brevibacillus centrosporus]
METEVFRPQNKVRFVTAASLYDGHDASINIMRRILQSSGVEVIHLGHNRSVDDIVTAAIQEDVQGIAISSYQGGHVEYFKYMIDLLKERGAEHIRVFGGGGGVIVPREIRELEEYGVCKIYSPDDGRNFGLQGMINDMIRQSDFPTVKQLNDEVQALRDQNHKAVARLISVAEYAVDQPEWVEPIKNSVPEPQEMIPVLGITGTGGAGKSSLTDELVRRFIRTYTDKTVAILSVDPSKQKSGGALLGDRIRMNANNTPRVYMRSLATRKSGMELSAALEDAIRVARAAHFDLIIVETSGIGQGDAQVTDVCDVSMYVMTSEFGAPSQLEKIDMLDFADVIAINKFERKGSEDALREVRKQYRRNHQLFELPDEKVPVYGTIASQFNDPGTNVLFAALMHKIVEKTGVDWSVEGLDTTPVKIHKTSLIPTERINYLQDIANTVRKYSQYTDEQSTIARKLFQLQGAKETLLASGEASAQEVAAVLDKQIELFEEKLHPECKRILAQWPKLKAAYKQDQFVTKIRDKELVTKLFSESLSGTRISKVAVPEYEDWGEILKWSLKENVPGEFPYTAGVFPFKREGEDPKRQFAGEGTPERTNRRFHFLSQNDEAKRLSTAFDSVTLYGEDPDYRPDIYGKIGTSGVSICTLDDMKKLYAGFDLCAPSTSVSMTINGPAPMILAMFMNTAIEQQMEAFVQREGRQPTAEESEQIKAYTLSTVRGTVQADILKEDQGQNTCIFSTEFALRMMGDIQQYFIDKKVRNYYSVSISGYHIAEAGANPITQLAFTLANGFTYVEYYLSRGMNIDDFAPNLSFFFSNGLDPEYTVIGRVARRIWATVMKNRYSANDRSQKLKYHIQTSGRSLHAQEMDFNDIRTTLQALVAIYDNCNSLHTNAYDEAITTPTENSVRRAMAIQMIINKELGLAKNENPLQGAFIIDELTDLVEEAVMQEFERISSRGGVLGAMETQYQRGKIQDESMYYEMKKHTGELPIIGVNTFINPNSSEEDYEIELARATEEEKVQQILNLRAFQEKHREQSGAALRRLQEVATSGGNIFEELMETVKVASLGQISAALYEVGGQYRRNM